MGFTKEDYKNPNKMFEIRTRQLRVRIQKLESFLVTARHPFTRAVVKQELSQSVDEYVNRLQFIQGNNQKSD